ncbi:hypothetical protein [Streptomyces sp. NPDC002540]
MITQADGSQERRDARDVTASQGETRLIVLAPMPAILSPALQALP